MRHSKPVRLQTAPTRGESIYLFLEFTINTKTNPLNPAPDKSGCTTYQGDFDKCLLISRVYYSLGKLL